MSTPDITLAQHTAGVEVRLRSDEYTSDEAVYLYHAPFLALEQLVTMMGRWGIHIDGNSYTSASGQFVVAQWGAGFEVIISTRGD